jgi:regulatory protein
VRYRVRREKSDKPPEPLKAGDALTYAVRALAQKSLTERELEVRLKRRNASPEVIASTLERLRQNKFVNDATVAEYAVRDANLGSGAIRMKLKARGVNTHTIEDALQHRDPDADLEGALALVERYGPRWTGPRGYAKGFAFLARRGFPSGVVHQALAGLRDLAQPEDFELEMD